MVSITQHDHRGQAFREKLFFRGLFLEKMKKKTELAEANSDLTAQETQSASAEETTELQTCPGHTYCWAYYVFGGLATVWTELAEQGRERKPNLWNMKKEKSWDTKKLRARKCTGRQGADKRCFKHIRTHENSSREKWKRKIKEWQKTRAAIVWLAALMTHQLQPPGLVLLSS